MKSHEKILPNLPDNQKLLEAGIVEEHILDLSRSYGFRQPEFAEEQGYSAVEIGSNYINLKFFELICRLKKCKTIFEIGTFTGMATVCFAKIDDVEKVVSIEKFDKFAKVAEKNFVLHGVQDKITLICGDAMDILNKNQVKDNFDLIFIDGDKSNYYNYFIKCLEISDRNSIFIIDDFFFHGDIFNSQPTTEKGDGVKKLVEYLRENQNQFRVTVIPIGNGVGLVEHL